MLSKLDGLKAETAFHILRARQGGNEKDHRDLARENAIGRSVRAN